MWMLLVLNGLTMDGSTLGGEYENFNAAVAIVTINGLNVHPGYAKHKMKNSMRIATQVCKYAATPRNPEHTEGYEGFYHLVGMEGTVEKTTLTYIIRDHDRDKFENRKKEIQHLANKINAEFGENTAVVEMRDQYYNMREKVEPVMHIVDLAFEAMKENGIEPIVKPIRGGTDGSRLSYEGLPCPNIFAGGHNFHGRFEYLPIQNMEKAMMVIVKIAELLEKKS